MMIKDIMSKDIISVNIDFTLKYASLLMLNYNISFLPVESNNQIIGCLNDNDIVIYGISCGNKKISEIM